MAIVPAFPLDDVRIAAKLPVMLDYWILLAARATLGLGLFVVVFSAWLPKRDSVLDFLMPAGASLAFVCFLSEALVMIFSSPFDSFDSAMFSYVGTAMGVLLYAFGFLMDRLARRRQVAATQGLTHANNRPH